MIKEKYFRVKYGFGVMDKVSISENELEKAIYAQITGSPIHLKDSYINGRNIISISPDYHKYTGWYDSYEPKDGDDFKQIERDCPDFTGVVEQSKSRVNYLIQTGRVKDIGTNISIPQLNG